jgi:hypothetical protein
MNITKELALQLLLESDSFRNYVVDKIFSLSSLSSLVRSSVLDYISQNKDKKIDCIKYVRQNFTVTQLNESFPDFVFEPFQAGEDKVGLKSAKLFVEQILLKM